MANLLLKVTGLKVAYGGIQAVKGVDFEVKEGELVTLIGSNGAGKTTTMKAITGTLAAAEGDIEYLGKSIKGKGSWDLVREGLAMVPEGRGVFARMTITENLQMGAYIREDKPEIANDIEMVSGLKVAYGGIQAVKGVDFEVKEGELVTLIGSNGAGKTTTMKAITGTLPAADGDIEYLGKSIKGKGSWDLVREGLAMVPEGRGVFTRMTITENLQMGAYIREDKPEIANDIEMVLTAPAKPPP